MSEELEPPGSLEQMRQAFGCFPSGVLAVCARVDEVPVGMAMSSFTSVSLVPPLVTMCVQHTSATWPLLRACPRLGLNVLAEHQDQQCRSFASKQGDRFSGSTLTTTPEGAIFVEDATLWLDCSIQQEIPVGDHMIIVLLVHLLRASVDRSPLVFHGSRFRRLVMS